MTTPDYRCRECSADFPSQHALFEHEQRGHRKNLRSDGSGTMTGAGLMGHGVAASAARRARYDCPDCQSTFPTEEAWQQHQETVH